MKGREYQLNQIDEGATMLSTKRTILMQSPTGSGKTVMFSTITNRYITNYKKSVLILVHREELMYQAEATIKKITGYSPFLITSQTKNYRYANIYIAMVDSLGPRLGLIDNLGLVIIDECHIANFNKIHSVFLNELIIGFSATPISASKKSPLNSFYQDIVTGVQISELIKSKFLSHDITRRPKNAVDTKGFRVSELTGDFDNNQLSMEFKKSMNVVNTMMAYKKFCNNEKTLIFNVNIEHSLEVTSMLVEFGVNAKHLDANSKDRKEILQWYKDTPDAVLCNVMIATVGFDEPTIRNVILNFDTLSLPKYLQCCGRGGRIIDWELSLALGCETKFTFNIIDMSANSLRFGRWSDDRDWKFIFENPDCPTEGGIAPVKDCPNCEAIVHAASTCCEYCGHLFKIKDYAEEKFGEFIIIANGIDLLNLAEKNKKKYDYYFFKSIAEDFVFKMFEDNKKSSLTRMQDAFEKYYILCSDFYNINLSGKEGFIDEIKGSGWHIRRAKSFFHSELSKYDFEYYEMKEDRICGKCGDENVDCVRSLMGDLMCKPCKEIFIV